MKQPHAMTEPSLMGFMIGDMLLVIPLELQKMKHQPFLWHSLWKIHSW